MTRISFHFGTADRLVAAADWLAGAVRQGRRITVLHASRTELDAFGRRLWSQPATGFLPHCFAADSLAAETPVILTQSLGEAQDNDCLLNLDDSIPDGFARFADLAEFVSTEADNRARGRERYKFYRERGYAIDNIDLGAIA